MSENPKPLNLCRYGNPEFCLPSLQGGERSIFIISLGPGYDPFGSTLLALDVYGTPCDLRSCKAHSVAFFQGRLPQPGVKAGPPGWKSNLWPTWQTWLISVYLNGRYGITSKGLLVANKYEIYQISNLDGPLLQAHCFELTEKKDEVTKLFPNYTSSVLIDLNNLNSFEITKLNKSQLFYLSYIIQSTICNNFQNNVW